MTTCQNDWLCESEVPPGEGSHSLLYTRYFAPGAFKIGYNGLESMDLETQMFDKIRQDLDVKPSIAPHLWITIGGQQHELGKLEGANPLQLAMGLANTDKPDEVHKRDIA